jgi:hypothetical protein
MLERLGIQSREIMLMAITAVRDENFRSLSNYRMFRRRVSEFEAFCNIIEGHLKEVVGDRRAELEDRFYSLWSMIFRPTVKALSAFFKRMSKEEVFPLGGRDLMESELRTLASMRNQLTAPRFGGIADQGLLREIDNLEELIRNIAERATSLPDFAHGAAHGGEGEMEVEAAPEQAGPRVRARVDAAQPANSADAPNVKAVREFRALLDSLRRDAGYGQYVDTDSRALDEIERKLIGDPMNAATLVWLRQIGNAWMARLGDSKELRRILGTIRTG